ncbi:hypothetical protein [Desulfoferula mesophila]
MIELFAEWAPKKRNRVTDDQADRLQENPSKNRSVTNVTSETAKNLSPGEEDENLQTVESGRDGAQNAVTPVTAVTPPKSLNNSCNPSRETPVTTVTNPLCRLNHREVMETKSWRPAIQRLFKALLDRFEKRGRVTTEAETLAYDTIKVLGSIDGGPVGLLPDELVEPTAMLSELFGPGVKLGYYDQEKPAGTSEGAPKEDGTQPDGTHK